MHSTGAQLVGMAAAGVSLAVLVAVEPAYAASTSVVPTASSGSHSGLAALSLLSATDGWAVGSDSQNGLTERYDGSSFSIVPSADLIDRSGSSSGTAGLTGVAAISANNALAVGTATTTGPRTVTTAVAERWNGTAWIRTAVPNPGSANTLNAVAATSATDAWAVGSSKPGATTLPFAVHWNGTAWAQVRMVAPGAAANVLTGVAGTSAHDMWAVGYSQDLTNGTEVKHGLVEHWNGSAWSLVPSLDNATGTQPTVLTGVAAVSPTDVWVVGESSAADGTTEVILLHSDGKILQKKLAVPALGRGGGVTVTGCDVWVAGSIAGMPAVAHLHGSTWTLATAPAPSLGGQVTLSGIAPNGSNGVIALGSSFSDVTATGEPIALGVTP